MISQDVLENNIVRMPWSGCWLWMRACSKAGYGQVRIMNKAYYTHRLSWQMKNGEIENGMCILHRCDTPSCCNPDHLFVGTKKDNYDDSIKKNRNPVIGKCGVLHSMAKLSAEKALAIRADDRSARLIAIDYGVSRSLITLIKRGGVWN